MTYGSGKIVISTVPEGIQAMIGNQDAFTNIILNIQKGTATTHVHNEHGSVMNTFLLTDFLRMLDMLGAKAHEEAKYAK